MEAAALLEREDEGLARWPIAAQAQKRDAEKRIRGMTLVSSGLLADCVERDVERYLTESELRRITLIGGIRKTG